MAKPLQGQILRFVEEINQGVRAEIKAVTEDSASAIEVRNGAVKAKRGIREYWTFEFDGELPQQPEMRVAITVRGGDPVGADFVAIDGDHLICALNEDEHDFDQVVESARLSFEPWFIYEELELKLEGFCKADEVNADLAEALLDMTGESDEKSRHLSGNEFWADQGTAVDSTLLPGLHFIWGPPGTGKTATLARSVKERVEQGDTVLIVATANAAVDVAMARICQELEGTVALKEGRVLRVGDPYLEEALNCTEILPLEIIRRQQPELIALRDELLKEKKRVVVALKRNEVRSKQEQFSRELDEVRERLSEVKKKIKEAELLLGRDAQVIGVTLARLMVNPSIWSWPGKQVLDAMIVDEASMAGFPFLLAGARRCAKSIVCFGDFRQLSPISQSKSKEAERWFGRDVFEIAGVVSRLESGKSDPRLKALQVQYRMGEQIADTVGKLAYFGGLKTDPEAAIQAGRISTVPPLSGKELVIVDTSALFGACQVDPRQGSFSRFNALSANVAVTISHGLFMSGIQSIGVTTPYRAQSQLLQGLLKEAAHVDAATVHKFQGSERDAMVIDLVDSWPQNKSSKLTGASPDTALRLLNVAISRGRGKVVICADLEFITQAHPLTSPTRRLIEEVVGEANKVSILDVVTAGLVSPTTLWCDGWGEAIQVLKAESVPQGDDVLINLPTRDFLDRGLDQFVKRQVDQRNSVEIWCPIEVARDFEKEKELKITLRNFGNAGVAFVGEEISVVGGRQENSPTCVVKSRSFNAVLKRLSMP